MNFQQNYFELFDLPIHPILDKEDLSSRYRELQRTVHPDKFAHATEHEQRMALQYATFINEAYETIKSDLTRFIYILELNGILLADESDTVETEFLMEQIELRENLEQITESVNAATEIEKLDARVNDILDTCKQEFINLFQDDDPSMHTARKFVRKMQYLTKLVQEIEHVEDQILDC